MMNRKKFFVNGCSWLLIAVTLISCNLATILSGEAEAPTPSTPEPGGPVMEATQQPSEPDPAAPPTISAESVPTDSPTRKPVVVYIKDGDLWRWVDGHKQRLTQQGMVFDPRLSRDGRLAVFRRPADDFHHELWVVNVADPQAGERRLVDIATLDRIGGAVRDASAVAINPYAYEWVGNTHLLAFNTHQVFNGPGLAMLDDLYLADADSLSVREVFPPGSGGEFVISPDGSRLALIRPDRILSASLDGSGQQTLLNFAAVTTYSEYRYYPTPQWSPDSRYLRVGIPPADPLAEPVQPAVLWKLPLDDAGAPQQEGTVTTVPFFAQSPYNRPVLYSLDLKRIVYLRDIGAPEENRRELALATYDGLGEVVLARGNLLESFGWSPDGRRVAFTQGDLQELWIGGLDAAPKPAAGAQFGITGLRWVDAKRFLAMQQQGQAYSLLLVNINGKVIEIDGFAATPTDYDFALTD